MSPFRFEWERGLKEHCLTPKPLSMECIGAIRQEKPKGQEYNKAYPAAGRHLKKKSVDLTLGKMVVFYIKFYNYCFDPMPENQNYLNIFGLIAFFSLIAVFAVQYMSRLTALEYGYPTYSFLIFTELLVICGLVIGVTGVVACKAWSNRFFLISSGMLLYSLLFSLGKYFEAHRFSFLVLFLYTAVLTLILLAAKLFFKKKLIDLGD